MVLTQDQERCLKSLLWAVEALQGQADLSRLTKISDLIIQTMTGPWRFFHTPEHIFEVGGAIGADGDAIEVLAALFHDLVYVQVDQGISVNIGSYISTYVKETEGRLMLRTVDDLPQDTMFELTMAVFGFKPGQPLEPTAGQNEFLSAFIAVKSLRSLLPLDVLVQIAACIEATIPFRSRIAPDLSAADLLFQRLLEVNQQFRLNWSESQTRAVVMRAVRVANRDVENFAFSSSADFLANTWNLLPETNHHLKSANSYTVQGYRTSIQKMERFMRFLKPDVVFQQFGGEPDNETYQGLIERTHKNLEVAKLYLGTKLVSIAIIEALSLRIGRDVPISTMMGELPSDKYTGARLEQFLPQMTSGVIPKTPIEKEVLELLEKGRSLDSSYDVKNSPIATFVVKLVGFAEMGQMLVQAQAFFDEQISAEEFIAGCNSAVVERVTKGIAQLFDDRRVAIAQVTRDPNRAIAS
jgi:hypothetical protein